MPSYINRDVNAIPVYNLDPDTLQPSGTSSNPNTIKAVNTQSRQANTVALPAFFILAKDVNNNDALIGVSAVSRGTENMATGQATAATTSTLLVPARVGRSAVTITNLGTTDVFVGNTGVTTATGQLLAGVKGTSLTLPTGAAIYGVVSTGSQAVSFVETF